MQRRQPLLTATTGSMRCHIVAEAEEGSREMAVAEEDTADVVDREERVEVGDVAVEMGTFADAVVVDSGAESAEDKARPRSKSRRAASHTIVARASHLVD
jgi:hypothetical protein